MKKYRKCPALQQFNTTSEKRADKRLGLDKQDARLTLYWSVDFDFEVDFVGSVGSYIVVRAPDVSRQEI